MRFRRSKDELARGLTPEQAKAEREGNGTPIKKPARKTHGGEIVIRIIPAKGVDPDYFEHLRDRVIEVSQDEHWYKWLDHYLAQVYASAGNEKLFLDILNKGIGSLVTHVHFTKDIE